MWIWPKKNEQKKMVGEFPRSDIFSFPRHQNGLCYLSMRFKWLSTRPECDTKSFYCAGPSTNRDSRVTVTKMLCSFSIPHNVAPQALSHELNHAKQVLIGRTASGTRWFRFIIYCRADKNVDPANYFCVWWINWKPKNIEKNKGEITVY